MTFIGYHDRKSLPIKPGMKVRIKKGVPVRVTTPGREGVRPAGKTYTIKVDHVLNGESMVIGDVVDGKFYERVRPKDLYGVMERRGMPVNDTTSMEALKQEALGNLRPLTLLDGTESKRMSEAVLHVCNPTVRWPGPGGYWSECDLNLVEVVA